MVEGRSLKVKFYYISCDYCSCQNPSVFCPGVFAMMEVKTKVGKRRVIVIPKKIAEASGIREGLEVKIRVTGEGLAITPVLDAVELSLKGRKVARITLKELEGNSLEQQEKILG